MMWQLFKPLDHQICFKRRCNHIGNLVHEAVVGRCVASLAAVIIVSST